MHAGTALGSLIYFNIEGRIFKVVYMQKHILHTIREHANTFPLRKVEYDRDGDTSPFHIKARKSQLEK